MRVYEAIVKGLESVGVDAAFGGAGENAAGLMLALKHSEQIRPVITRHEQAASFMACGYAMFTDRLGFCFATAGPGAFNLFSGLAVAMSDSYPVLAVSGYASLEWRGRGSLNETSGLNRTPDSHAMFAGHDQGVVAADRHRRHLRRARGGRQPRARRAARAGAHPRAREPHAPRRRGRATTTTSASTCGRSRPIRPAWRRSPRCSPTPSRAGEKVVALVGFGAIRSGAGPEVKRSHRALPDPAADHPGRQGHRRESPSAVRRACSATAATRARGRRSCEADVVLCDRQRVQPARDIQLPRRPVRRHAR